MNLYRRYARKGVRLTFATGAMLLAGIGCRDQLIDPGTLTAGAGVTLQTDSLAYHWAFDGVYKTQLVVTLTNKSAGTVYLPECHPGDAPPDFGLTRAASDTGRIFIFTAAQVRACLYPTKGVAFAPGQSRVDTLWLGSTVSPNANPPIGEHERVGSFRATYVIYGGVLPDGTVDNATLLPLERRQSNVFSLAYSR